MTISTERIPGPTRVAGGRRRRFSLRATALWFAAVALLLCGAGFAVRILAGAAAAHPVAAVLVVAACAPAVWSFARAGRRLRLRRTARRAARALALECAAAEIAVAEPEPVAPATAPEGADDGHGYGYDYNYDDNYDYDYDALDADAFEAAVAELCERDGCRDVQVVGGAGDLGADVVATTPDGRRVVIQCKRYCATNKVGSQDVQRFGGTCYAVHEADVAAVVTTSDFTTPAAEYAEQCGILCFDRQALLAWSAATGPAPWG
ncbi:restriction endonuclease [Streptomyces sp. NPDC046161]|uniref:restriction endonuclease n=1 Tax=Streptomyces sp. NPDC046161 TaxID=3155132 RepID=UPI0033DC6B69